MPITESLYDGVANVRNMRDTGQTIPYRPPYKNEPLDNYRTPQRTVDIWRHSRSYYRDYARVKDVSTPPPGNPGYIPPANRIYRTNMNTGLVEMVERPPGVLKRMGNLGKNLGISFATNLAANYLIDLANRNTPTPLERFLELYPNDAPPQSLIDNHNLIRPENPYPFPGRNPGNQYTKTIAPKLRSPQGQLGENLLPGVAYRVYYDGIHYYLGIKLTEVLSGGNPEGLYFTTVGPYQIYRLSGYGHQSGKGIFVSFIDEGGQQIDQRLDLNGYGGLFEVPAGTQVNFGVPAVEGSVKPTKIRRIPSFEEVPPPPAVYFAIQSDPPRRLLDAPPPITDPTPFVTDLLKRLKKPLAEGLKDALKQLSPDDFLKLSDPKLREKLAEELNERDRVQQQNAEAFSRLTKSLDDLEKRIENGEELDSAEREIRESVQSRETRRAIDESVRQALDTGNEPTDRRPPIRDRVPPGDNPGGTEFPSNRPPSVDPIPNNPEIAPSDRRPPVLRPDPDTRTEREREIRDRITGGVGNQPPAQPPARPRGCEGDDPLAECLGQIEAGLSDLRNKQSPPVRISGAVANVKCDKFGELDSSPGSFPYSGNDLLGISEQLKALTLLVTEAKKDICRLEVNAVVPDRWDGKLGKPVPQLVVLYRTKDSNGKPGKSLYSVSIPHFNSPSRKPNIRPYDKGPYICYGQFVDGSQLRISAKSPESGMTYLQSLLNLTDRSKLVKGSPKTPTKRSDAVAEVRVYPVCVTFFPEGQKTKRYAWRTYYNYF